MEPQTVATPAGRSIQMHCNFAAKPRAKVTWFKNGKQLQEGERANGEVLRIFKDHLYLENVTPGDKGRYTCRAENKVGSSEYSYDLLVQDNMPYPPLIDTTLLFSRYDLRPGDNVTLECRLESLSEPMFDWRRKDPASGNWTVLQSSLDDPNSDPHYLHIPNFTANDTGSYSCFATNAYGDSEHVVELQLLALAEQRTAEPSPPATLYAAVATVSLFAFILISFLAVKMWHYKKRQITVVHAEQSFIIRRVVVERDSNGKSLTPRVKIETETVNLNQLGAAEKKRALNEYQLPLDKDWEVMRDKLAIGEKLGEGAFGVVFKATAHGLEDKETESMTTEVAVKMLKDSHTDSDLRDLVSEMEVMKKVGRHRNIISLLGCVTQDGLFHSPSSPESRVCLLASLLLFLDPRLQDRRTSLSSLQPTAT